MRGTNATDVIEVYDPSTDSWRAQGTLAEPMGAFSTAIVDRAVLVIGGARQLAHEGQPQAVDNVESHSFAEATAIEAMAWAILKSTRLQGVSPRR